MQDELRLMQFLLPLLKQSEKFEAQTAALVADPDKESFDVMELKDERVFECYSKPQQIRDRICGRVWSIRDVSEQKRMQREIDKSQQQLLLASRQAGMAEVATGVLHNVGNVLNSVNISTTLMIDGLGKSKISNVARLGEVLTKKSGDLAAFVTTDASGRELPAYVNRLAERLNQERNTLLKECELVRTNIDHIKDIVAMQQNYAKALGVVETVKVTDLIDAALRLNDGALMRHQVEVVREYRALDCEITVEKHKVLQILVNLIRNAKHACDDSGRSDKRLTICSRNDQERVQIEVVDNGIGIPVENLTRIFGHGFTTREKGHGFGLHSAALGAAEMGGSLIAKSEGPQRGSSFILDLPRQAPKK
jgi:C4-dicarboxylate-specific signal transduction histidine kinase